MLQRQRKERILLATEVFPCLDLSLRHPHIVRVSLRRFELALQVAGPEQEAGCIGWKLHVGKRSIADKVQLKRAAREFLRCTLCSLRR